jgi:hypothetical protein
MHVEHAGAAMGWHDATVVEFADAYLARTGVDNTRVAEQCVMSTLNEPSQTQQA